MGLSWDRGIYRGGVSLMLTPMGYHSLIKREENNGSLQEQGIVDQADLQRNLWHEDQVDAQSFSYRCGVVDG